MRTYTWPATVTNASHLWAEIQAAHGVDVSEKHHLDGSTLHVWDEFDAIDLQATIDAHTPALLPVWITKRDFLARFTDDEYIAIWASTDVLVMRLRDELLAEVGDLNLTSDRMLGGITYLTIVERENEPGVMLIAANRPAELLADPTP